MSEQEIMRTLGYDWFEIAKFLEKPVNEVRISTMILLDQEEWWENKE